MVPTKADSTMMYNRDLALTLFHHGLVASLDLLHHWTCCLPGSFSTGQNKCAGLTHLGILLPYD